MSDIIEQTSEQKTEKNELVVNLSKENFADMILNFLGKKEELTYRSEENGYFKITLDDIEEFYFLLEQKINREQSLILDAFSMELFYDNGTKRVVHSFEKIAGFVETRNIKPKAVLLEWHIIVKFNDSPHVETQKIQLLFKAYDNEYIGIVVEHTDQIWGMEVLSLFENQIKNIYVPEKKSNVYAKKIKIFLESTPITTGLTIIIVFLIMVFIESLDKNIRDDLKFQTINKVININSQEDKKLVESSLAIYMIDKDYRDKNIIDTFSTKEVSNEMKNYIDNKNNNSNSFKKFLLKIFISIYGFYTILYFYLVYVIRYNKKNSFILLTKKAHKDYETYKDDKNNKQFYSISLIAFTLIIGLVINFVSVFLF
ncbi:hypothetical protein [Sulfuricurvum sp.]|uniref:hypothetical protein n=1 Tax=Sulfuricurvum sp. TaxID=2025608 RepID=UPI003BB0CA86